MNEKVTYLFELKTLFGLFPLLFLDIQNGVELLKIQLYDMIQDEEIWIELEETIDQFVKKRRNGYIY